MRSAAAVLIGVLALACGAMASDYTWALNNDGSSFYTITGTGSVAGQNPTVTLPFGKTLHLDITSTSSHPVCVQTNDAVTGASNYANIVPAGTGCVQTGTYDITLPTAGSGTNAIYLHCKFHGFAITVNLQDPTPSSSSTGGAAATAVSSSTAAAAAASSSTGGAAGPDYTWNIVNPSASDFFYTISGTGAVAGNNPSVTLPFGKTLRLSVSATSSHPVCVQTNNAVTGVSNYANIVPAGAGCLTTGTFDITLPSAASGTAAIYLHCKFHTFAVTVNLGAETSSTGSNGASAGAVASAAVVLLASAIAVALRA